MKTIEEKAKAYDEAIEKTSKLIDEGCLNKMTGEFIFPELKESENERIRTKLLNLLKELLELGGVAQDTWSMTDCEQFIAWLEKQGEQKPIDAIEEDNDFTIYHPIKNECSNKYECFPYSFYGSIKAFHNNEELLCFLRNCFYKEEDCEKWCREQNEQKPVEWSEEDELMRESIIDTLKLTFGAVQMKIDWLKSLKDRCVPQKEYEWSEEDKKRLEDIVVFVSGYADKRVVKDWVEWLKSLRPQKQWNPSDEQIKDFESVINDLDRMHNAVGYMDNHTKTSDRDFRTTKSIIVMKANEAPEKIYVYKTVHLGLLSASVINITGNDVEYTRTDAFIEKAEEFIYSALNDGIMGTANIEDFMRLFKKYMKGE